MYNDFAIRSLNYHDTMGYGMIKLPHPASGEISDTIANEQFHHGKNCTLCLSTGLSGHMLHAGDRQRG